MKKERRFIILQLHGRNNYGQKRYTEKTEEETLEVYPGRKEENEERKEK